MKFQVWDEINGCAEEAKTIEAGCANDAAVAYAERDIDGWTDGLYHTAPHPIVVQDPYGNTWIIEIEAEMEPHFRVKSGRHVPTSSSTSKGKGS